MLKEYPKISIVTPSYNQSQFLEATIQSILSQNYPNLEYIIIDGGSTDGSIDIIKKYENHLHFWCSEPDAGQYDAINKGFRHSTGEIMAWLNSDDMYLPWTFKTIADIMSTLPNIEWLTTLSPGGWDYEGFCSGFGNYSGYSLQAFLDGCYLPLTKGRKIGWIQQESTFWRRNLWNKSGCQLNTDIELASDFDLWSRFYINTELFGTTSPLAGFRTQLDQKSGNINQYIKEAEVSLAIMRHHLQWSPNSIRDILLTSKFDKIPKLKQLAVSQLGYTGKKIVRKKLDQPDGCWEIENYSFLY